MIAPILLIKRRAIIVLFQIILAAITTIIIIVTTKRYDLLCMHRHYLDIYLYTKEREGDVFTTRISCYYWIHVVVVVIIFGII